MSRPAAPRRRRRTLGLVVAGFVASGVAGCGEDPTRPGPGTAARLDYTGTWNPASNFGGPFGHDGMPVESDNFIVYSGGASTGAREHVAEVAEESLEEVLDWLSVGAEDFDFVAAQPERKIHVMAIATQDFGNNTGFAYRDGLVVISTEAEQYRRFGFTPEVFKRLIKHEGTHVVEFLLIGDPQYQQASDVWWREGFAHYMSRPRPSMITTVAEVEAWRSSRASLPGGGNPVSIGVWSDFPPSVIAAGQTFSWYDMFELTVRYLLDPAGFGAEPADVVALYEAMGAGTPFDAAMERSLGVDVDELRTDYWDRITTWLERLEADPD